MTWYAVEADDQDSDWGTGSYDYDEAVAMLKEFGSQAQIAVIDEGEHDSICEYVIPYEEAIE